MVIIGITFLLSAFWSALGFGSRESPILAFFMMIAFGINIAGLIFSFSENKIDKKKSIIGLIGNLTLIIGFLAIMGYALTTMNSVG